ncbi:Fe(3+)-hydroxamate ABC transporter permease FhuB [Paraburkholderia caffeinilytica]|uniref:Fe(3+)-hydroxamate ABC transporter permease FhuB n=1 Tax=Paraburkholderia caffeinilytica TaxID=1761016 RepID=UPI0038BC8046
MASSPLAPARDFRLALVAGFGVVALVLAGFSIHAQLDGASFWTTLFAPDRTDLHQVLVRDSLLPRIAMTLLCGGALGLAGTLTQQVLRNPLAEPLTLGIFPGAYLALMIAGLWAPSWLALGRPVIALAGGALAMLVVFALAARQRMASLAVILSGMVVNLYCGAISLALSLSHFDLLRGLMIWGGGALDQTGWQDTRFLTVAVAVCGLATLLLRRAFAVFEAGDSTVSSLGVGLQRMRFAALLIALVLTACVVSTVGVIAFVGLAAPMLARLAGARRLGARLAWAPAIGAALLWATDELVRVMSSVELFSAHLVPTGTVTSLVGVPFLLLMLPRLRSQPDLHAAAAAPVPHGRLARRLPLAIAGLVLVIALGFCVSRGADGWRLASLAQIEALAFWRLPHLVAALAAGVLLAVAGTLIQRVTTNPMASPDLLGVSSGGALGILVVLLLGLAPTSFVLFIGCGGGALATLALVVWFGARASFAPERMLLVGVAISALFQAVVSALLASGDSRGDLLLNLIIGSTYDVEPGAAYAAGAIALLSLVLGPLLGRWIDTLALGATTATSLGVPVPRARAAVLVLAAFLTAAATLLVGPLSFVGLVAPHIARYSGARKAGAQIGVAALVGALLMGLAEWLGRQIAFPQEMPAGLVATLIGGPYLVVLMLRRRASAT